MFAANLHHHFISIFLIITFFTFTICIQNANLIDNHDNLNHQYESTNDNDWTPLIMTPMGRQSAGGNYYEDNTINAGEAEKGNFAFPTNDGPYSFEYPSVNTNKNTRPPPSSYDYDNYYSYLPNPPQQQQLQQQQKPHQYTQNNKFQSFNSNLNSNLQNVPGYDNYRKTTYQQNYPNYAQNHGIYLNNNQRPNYNRPPQSLPPQPQRPLRPTPPARPPSIYYGGGGSGVARPPQSSNSQYASQFSNFFGPLSNLLGGGGGGSSTGSSSSNAITQGLEQISRNDDLECVPKVLCQMVGNPERRAQLPSYITSPGLQALISALPAASPALIYGRAALLGLTGGDRVCANTYSKCPKEEDEILFYLNNHRGGFFKFFNEPGGSPYKPIASTTQSPFGVFMNFLGGNTNSAVSSMMTSTGNTLGSFIGNILYGLAGGNTMYARSSRDKRNIEKRILNEDVDEDEEPAAIDASHVDGSNRDTEEQDENTKMIISVPDDDEKPEGVEGRILNQGKIQAEEEERPSNRVKFPYHEEEGLRYGRLYDPSEEYNNIPSSYNDEDTLKVSQDNRYAKKYNKGSSNFVKFPYHEEEDTRYGRLYDPSEEYNNIPASYNEESGGTDTLKFSQDHRYAKQFFYDGNYPEQSGSKVVFPEHTSSGNLRFDNHRYSSTSSNTRFGKILNRPNYSANNYQSNDAGNYNNYYNRRPYYSRRDYGTTTDYRPARYQPARTTPKPVDNDFEGNTYVTNSQGVVEYYVNKQGAKVYI